MTDDDKQITRKDMAKVIDNRLGVQVDIEARKGADFHRRFYAQIISGDTYVDVDFSNYSGATLQVRRKPDSPVKELTFKTTDNTITFGLDGRFDLKQTNEIMDGIRAGEYHYDMYLSNANYPKRDFIYGKFIISNSITR